jgi:hypothetical protein
MSLGLFAFAAAILRFDMRLKIFGMTVEETLSEADKEVRAAPAAPGAAQLASPPEAPKVDATERGQLSEVVSLQKHEVGGVQALEEAFHSRVEQIRRELIVLAGNSGRLPAGTAFTSPTQIVIDALLPANVLSSELISAIRLVEGLYPTARPASEGALSLGLALAGSTLQKLRTIPRSYTRIVVGDVPLFCDKSLSTLHPARGVMVTQTDGAGVVHGPYVYPRKYDYQPSRVVTWEWDMKPAYHDAAFFRDPRSGDAHSAFSSSATFAGRPYPSEWGVEDRLPG